MKRASYDPPVADRVAAFAPGRVNLIGEHTDYNDGLALPFAIAQGVTVRADFAGDELVVDAPGAERFARGVAAAPGGGGGGAGGRGRGGAVDPRRPADRRRPRLVGRARRRAGAGARW